MSDLSLSEQLIIIAQHPEKAFWASSTISIQYTLVGAFLLEMTLEEQLEVKDDILVLKELQRIENPIHSKLAELVKKSSKPRKMRYWISKMAVKYNTFKKQIQDKLHKERILKVEHKRFLGIPYRRCYLRDSRTRNQLIQDYRSKLLKSVDLTDKDLVMLGLMHTSNMASILAVNRAERKIIRKKLKEKSKESAISRSVNKTMQEMQAAVMVAVTASSAAVTASSS